MHLDPRIGMLNNGKFYCFPNGNGKPEFMGTLEEVETALGIPSTLTTPAVLAENAPANRLWSVTLAFQYPAWDEINGIEYPDIEASGKAEANAIARRLAYNDGHLCGGKGRVNFNAIEQ